MPSPVRVSRMVRAGEVLDADQLITIGVADAGLVTGDTKINGHRLW